MKNYKNLIAVIHLSAALAACGEKTAQPQKTDTTPAPFLDRYASELVKEHKSELLSHSAALKTQVSPLSYLTDFSTDDPAMLTRDIDAGDKSAIEKNRAITERWQEMYCTNTLQSLMQETGTAIASARLIDSFGKSRSVAMCIVRQPKVPPPLPDSAPVDTGQFSLGQICKAGISVVYGRDTSIMTTTTTDGKQAQVKYTRPTDGKAMSYQCKLDQGHILTWDDSLAGARWYGAATGDTKLKYHVIGDRLVIQDVIDGRVTNEKSYSFADISNGR